MNNRKIRVRLIGLVLVGFLSLLLTSGTGKAKNDFKTNELVIFPPPPDTARIQFLTSISSSEDVVGKPSFFKRYVFGIEPEKPIIKPYGIAVQQGKIFICDTMLPGLEIIDLKEKTFTYFTPSGLGQLKKPINCDLDETGNLYVADAGRGQVVVFDTLGNFLSTLDLNDQSKPTDVKVYNNKLFVCDLGTHQIRVFDILKFKALYSFPESEKDSLHYLYSPTNLCIKDGKVYVSDTGDARIKVFDEQGHFEGSVGSYGKQPGQFVRPKGIGVDSSRNLYVVDAAFENIQIFDEKSRLLLFFGGHSEQPGYMWLPAGLAIDEDHLEYFQKYVYTDYNLKYLVFVCNQYGPAKLNVYGFIEPNNKVE